MNRRCIYYVEGECERQLINSLKEQPSMIVPGKVKVYNVIRKLIPKSQLLTIQKDSIVVFLIDTDVDETRYLSQNIDRIRKYCNNIHIVNLLQVLNFEDEITRSTNVTRASELTKSKSVSNFKSDFCRMKTADCRKLLERHHFDIDAIWCTRPPQSFESFAEDNNKRIILKR